MSIWPKVPLFLFILQICSASELKEFCENDPTGELYSEIYDSFVEDGLNSIGLDPAYYLKLIEQNEDISFFELAEEASESHPEIAQNLRIWKLETCISRGYEMLQYQQ